MLQLRGAQLAELDLLSCGMLWISTWAGVDYPKQDYPTPRKSKLNCGLGGVNPIKIPSARLNKHTHCKQGQLRQNKTHCPKNRPIVS